jgi:hypothetical protein
MSAEKLTPSIAFFDFDGTLAKGDSLWPFLIAVKGWPRCLIALGLAVLAYLFTPPGCDRRTVVKDRLLKGVLGGVRLRDLGPAIERMRRYPEWTEGENFSLIEHLHYRCGIDLTATHYTLFPLHNVKSVADKLEIDTSSHIFFFEGVDHDTTQTPVLFSREYFAPWIFRFTVERTPDI